MLEGSSRKTLLRIGLNGLGLSFALAPFFGDYGDGPALISTLLLLIFLILTAGLNAPKQKLLVVGSVVCLFVAWSTRKEFLLIACSVAGVLALFEALRLEAVKYEASGKRGYFRTLQMFFLIGSALVLGTFSSLMRQAGLLAGLVAVVYVALFLLSIFYFYLGLNRLIRDIKGSGTRIDSLKETLG